MEEGQRFRNKPETKREGKETDRHMGDPRGHMGDPRGHMGDPRAVASSSPAARPFLFGVMRVPNFVGFLGHYESGS